MRQSVVVVVALLGVGFVVEACGSSQASEKGFSTTGAGEGGSGSSDDGSVLGTGSSGGTVGTFSDASVASPSGADGGVACPSGVQCNVSCSGSATTTVTGKVYDPAGKNALYNVAVYVPAVPLQPLPKGVPTGADACSCGALFKSGAVVNASTGVDGSFTLTNVPVGAKVPLVIQVGKWRHLTTVATTACTTTAIPDGTLKLPSTVAAGDTNDNMPDIAVSTGYADSLECLMTRMGLPASEYVAGAGSGGHVHIFAGGKGSYNALTFLERIGMSESPGMSGAPASPTSLWANQGQLMPYDIVLLSCEGGETYNANPQALEAYLNAGGRVFGSHYHYAWFAGPQESSQAYAVPSQWGSNLATWTPNGAASEDGVAIGGIIDTTLNGSTAPFAKGVALQAWLGDVKALGQNTVPANELSIYSARYDATVGPSNASSQPWITSDSSGQSGATMYFSFDTPVGAAPAADGGAPNYCGRAVFSDLHVSGNPSETDGTSPPSTCATTELSPQEKALEFMLFDLSSCVIPDTIAPPDAGLPVTVQ